MPELAEHFESVADQGNGRFRGEVPFPDGRGAAAADGPDLAQWQAEIRCFFNEAVEELQSIMQSLDAEPADSPVSQLRHADAQASAAPRVAADAKRREGANDDPQRREGNTPEPQPAAPAAGEDRLANLKRQIAARLSQSEE